MIPPGLEKSISVSVTNLVMGCVETRLEVVPAEDQMGTPGSSRGIIALSLPSGSHNNLPIWL